LAGQINDYSEVFLSGNLSEDISLFKEIFKKDVILRVKKISARNTVPFDCALVYMDGMVDSEQLNDAVIKPIITVDRQNEKESVADFIAEQILFARDVKKVNNVAKILEGVLYGEALLLIDKSKIALSIDVKGWKTRGISEPMDERILSGPREGFEEAALLNIALLRRKLITPDLCVEMQRVGRRTNTLVFVCYLGSLADEKTVKEIKKRISKLDIDGILDVNYVTEQIRDNKNSLFKTSGTTERPDVVASKLLEGRIAIIVDGTPVVATVPYLFSENFQSDEDYYQNYLYGSIGRILRYLCFFITICVPAGFVAISTFHKELLPTSFAISVMQLRAGVPFSPFLETLAMILVFEILKEAGVRTSQNLGHAISIVGGLVVGQAAVEARIIGAPTLIVVALGGIAGLMLPRLKSAVFYLRLLFVIIASVIGLFGLILGIGILLVYIFSLKSFGTDYTVSLTKANLQSLKDTVWRAPWGYMKKRPLFNKNLTRQREESTK
jgi:spore germination protein KA